jgi:regulator of RNase E activity RraB
MKQPYENGLRSSEEAPALHALEDALDERLRAALDAIYVGRYVGEGFTTFAFYLPADIDDATDRIGHAAGDTGPYELVIGIKSDPDWELYTAYLYPDEYGMQQIMNRRVMAAMQDAQDRPEVPRIIDHFAAFDSRAQCDKAIGLLRDAGFEVDDPERGEDERWGVSFHREEPLSDGQADAFCIEILDIVLPNGGDYDGWGAPVMAADS